MFKFNHDNSSYGSAAKLMLHEALNVPTIRVSFDTLYHLAAIVTTVSNIKSTKLVHMVLLVRSIGHLYGKEMTLRECIEIVNRHGH